MAKTKKKKPQINTADAIKVLANDTKQMQGNIMTLWENIQKLDSMIRDVMALFEHYIEHTKDGKAFVKKMEKLVEERANAQKQNEQANEENTDGDSENEGVGAEGVRAQEG